jgi:hypothetical protein
MHGRRARANACKVCLGRVKCLRVPLLWRGTVLVAVGDGGEHSWLVWVY